MAQMDISRIQARAKKGFNERDSNIDIYQDIAEFFTPFNDAYEQNGQSFSRPRRQFDSTPMSALHNFKASLTRNITPTDSRFAVLQAGPMVQDDEEKLEYNKTLDKVNDIIYAYLNASNFWTAIDAGFIELAKGTMCLWCRETNDPNRPFKFISTPISNIGISCGEDGEVDFIARKHKVKVCDLEYAYPDVQMTEDLTRLKAENPDTEVELLEAQYYDAENITWRYEIIFEKDRIFEIEYAERICFTPRWDIADGKALGVGVAMMALPDVRTANKSMELHLRSAAISVYGVYTMENDASFNPNNVKISPSSVIPVPSNANDRPSLRPLQTGGSYTAGKDMVDTFAERIKITMLDNSLPAERPQARTALEIAERVNQYAGNLGSIFARLRHELIIPMFQRMFGILYRQGKFADIEGIDAIKIDNLFTDIVIRSPIGLIQQQEEVEKSIRAFTMTAQIDPTLAMLGFDMYSLPQWLTEKLGGAPELLSDMSREELEDAVEAERLKQALAQGGGLDTISGDGGDGT